MNFDINLDPLFWICLAVAALTALLAFWTRFIPIWCAGSAVDITSDESSEAPDSSDNQDQDTPEEAFMKADQGISGSYFPKVSIIAYSFTEFEETENYLEMVMSQDYPNFEVILVNEGSADSTGLLTERIGKKYGDRLYITFIPHDAHNLSRRKLAYTVGMKAAKGEIALTTASNCRIPSRRWLSEMMKPFVEDSTIDIVLGYTHVDFRELHGAGKWYRQMDATLTACQWIGSAMLEKPYRGDCFNLAYRRQIFFEQKGYSHTIHLVNGDDDIFLTPIMDGFNTAVAISPASILTTEWDEVANRVLADMKERYQFTSQFLPPLPFIRSGIGSLMQWLTLLSAVAAAIAAWPSYMGTITAIVFLTVFWISETLIYRRTARRLESIGLWWSFPLFLLWLPIGNFIFKSRRRSNRRKNFTFA